MTDEQIQRAAEHVLSWLVLKGWDVNQPESMRETIIEGLRASAKNSPSPLSRIGSVP